MAQGVSAEFAGVLDNSVRPASKADGRVYNAKVRVFQATFDLSLAAVAKVANDTNVCFRLPAGYKPLFYASQGSVTMGASATLAFGNSTTPAKYRAAAVHTNTTLSFGMLSSALDDAPLSADEDVIMTIGTADLPGTGILSILFFCSAR